MLDKLIVGAAKYAINITNQVRSAVKQVSYSDVFGAGRDFIVGNRVTNPYSQIGAVYKAVRALADNAQQVEMVYKLSSNEEKVEDKNLDALFAMPNPYMTYSDFLQACIGFYALFEDCFIIIERSNGELSQAPGAIKLPASLYPLKPSNFRPVFETVKGFKTLVGWQYIPSGKKYSLKDIIHIKGFNPDSNLNGVSPTSVIAQEISISWNSLEFNKNFFGNSATPSLALSTDKNLSDTQYARMRQDWEDNFQGVKNAHKFAILEGGLKADYIGHSHKEMEFIEQASYMREEILGIFKVPKSLFSITEGATYNNNREQKLIFWEDTLLPMVMKLMDALTNAVVKPYNPNIYIDVDVSKIPAFKYAWEQKARLAKDLISINVPLNEANKRLGLGFPDFPWGNEPLVPFNLVPISMLGVATDTATSDNSKQIQAPEIKQIENQAVQRDPIESKMWQSFEKIHTKIAGRTIKDLNSFSRMLSNYFYEQRKRAIQANEKSFNQKDAANILIDWAAEDKILQDKAKPFLLKGIEGGIDFAESFGIYVETLGTTEAMKVSTLARLSKKITEVNKTVKNQINEQLRISLAEGETIVEASNRLRSVYNLAQGRSLTIARTETTGAMNSAASQYYKEAGITKTQWLVADGEARETHLAANGEKVPQGSKFSNGLLYPGDPGGLPEEVVNCRCTVLPVIE
jgi:HK97 family phage portal protein